MNTEQDNSIMTSDSSLGNDCACPGNAVTETHTTTEATEVRQEFHVEMNTDEGIDANEPGKSTADGRKLDDEILNCLQILGERLEQFQTLHDGEHETNAKIVVIDSIQTMYLEEAESTPGSVSQVRACAYELIKIAKRKGFVLFLVGHVTKQGSIAGPRVLEHMVDTVLYFEGERGHQFRILRAVKNRYGATDEIGVFEMQDKGLVEVENPSALFLAERQGNISGSCVFAGIEGSRPVLVEIQALVSQTGYASPKRAVVGWDSGRLAMVLAVLEARGGLNLSSQDVYLNIAGGLKISEPAADLAVAMAIISSLTNRPLPADMVIFGEIGLSGEIRAVSQPTLRLKEAGKLGFKSAIVPAQYKNDKKLSSKNISLHEIGNVQKLINWFN